MKSLDERLMWIAIAFVVLSGTIPFYNRAVYTQTKHGVILGLREHLLSFGVALIFGIIGFMVVAGIMGLVIQLGIWLFTRKR